MTLVVRYTRFDSAGVPVEAVIEVDGRARTVRGTERVRTCVREVRRRLSS